MRSKTQLSLSECKDIYDKWRVLLSQGGLDAEVEAARMEIDLTARLQLLWALVSDAPVEMLGNCVATYHDEATIRTAAAWLDRVRQLRRFEQARSREHGEFIRQIIHGETLVDVVYGE